MTPRIALIGAGMYAPITFKALLQFQAQGKAEFVAFAARTKQTVQKRQEQYGVKGHTDWKKMLEVESIDAVVVATPDHLHREMSTWAAGMGKHVLVEKPMDITVQGAREMLKTSEDNSILMQVDMHKRYDPYHHISHYRILLSTYHKGHGHRRLVNRPYQPQYRHSHY